jgi:drug/metabolite transporter (DMT)-like permease
MLRKFFDQTFAHKPILAILAALYAALAMGFSPVMVRLSEVGPFATAFFRFFLAFPILMTWMIFDNLKDLQPKTPHTKRDYFLIMGAGCFLAGDISFWYLSMVHTTLVNATLLNNLTIIIVPLAGWLLFQEKPTLSLCLGIFFTLLGSFILVGYSFSFQTEHLIGDLYGFISAFFYSAFMITVKKLRDHFRPPTILAWGALPTLYILGIAAYLNGDQFFPVTSLGWLWLFGLAIIVHVLGQGLLTYAMAHISAAVSVLILSLAPVFAAIFAWIIVDESLTLLQGVGAGIVLLGIIIAQESDFLTRLKLRKKI